MKKLMKYSWIVALLVALSFAFVACGGDSKTPVYPEIDPWVVDAADIELVACGGSVSKATVEGNTYALKSTGNETSAGFYWTLPTEANADGNSVSDYQKIRVTIKILELVKPEAGVSYNAKNANTLSGDVNRFGEKGAYQNGLSVIVDDASEFFTGDEHFEDYPVAEFKNGLIAFQWGNWADELGGDANTKDPEHKISVNFTFHNEKSEGEDEEDDEDDDEFDFDTAYAALKALAGGITIGVGGTDSPVWDATNKVVTVTASSSAMFYFDFDDTDVVASSLATDDVIVIEYACVVEIAGASSGNAHVIAKPGVNSWSSDGNGYPQFEAGNGTATKKLERTMTAAFLGSGIDGISFQHNNGDDPTGKYHIKIVSVKMKE